MLNVKSVDKCFNKGTIDEKILFSNFNLSVNKGEFVSVVGSNGSGKTTILNIISGDVAPDKGHVFIDGSDVSKKAPFQRAISMARVFQDPSVGTCSKMTIFENMSLADNKAKFFGLSSGLNKKKINFYKEKLNQLGMGLENRLDTLCGSLSGGQRQALALIMATLYTPKILLLDEHTAALDPRSADIVMHLTEKIIKEDNITTLMVTHNLRYATEYGTRSIMMHNGEIVLDVSGEEKKNKTIDDYLKQFNEISIECGN